MKKLFALFITITILAAMSVPLFAQGRSRRTNSAPAPVSDSRAYYDYGYRDGNVWDRHRDKLTLLMGTAGGAAIGSLIGGKRGAMIGAASGLGASALYTYKIRNRRYRY